MSNRQDLIRERENLYKRLDEIGNTLEFEARQVSIGEYLRNLDSFIGRAFIKKTENDIEVIIVKSIRINKEDICIESSSLSFIKQNDLFQIGHFKQWNEYINMTSNSLKDKVDELLSLKEIKTEEFTNSILALENVYTNLLKLFENG